MNVDKRIISVEMGRHWASVQMLIRAIRERLAELSESATDTFGSGPMCDRELSSALLSLSSSLSNMFAVEESEECRAEIVDDNPHLTDRLARSHCEHRELLATLDDLVELCAEDVTCSDLESRFDAFIRLLTVHEQCEARLMQRAAADDIGVGDQLTTSVHPGAHAGGGHVAGNWHRDENAATLTRPLAAFPPRLRYAHLIGRRRRTFRTTSVPSEV